jgi:cephalosporin-C deacetylase
LAELRPAGWRHERFEVYDLSYQSTGGMRIGGWVLVPTGQPIRRGFVIGHGYGGREAPDLDLPFDDAVLFFPCARGISRSRCAGLPEAPNEHVLWGIDDRQRYVLGGCVDDLWVAVTALLELFPAAAGRVAYLGVSFGGGVGAMAVPWDERIGSAHYNVPSFGHQPLRLTLPTVGSGEAVRWYRQQHGHVPETLLYYDAAVAAGFTRVPVHVAAALFDPAVAPPGQFAIYNALPGDKRLFVLDAGHFDYGRRAEQERMLLADLEQFLGR